MVFGMDFWEAINSEIVISCITVFGSVLVVVSGAVISNWHSKRIKFFEIYFNKKADAYERYLAVIEAGMLLHNFEGFAEASTTVQLYCPEELLPNILEFTTVGVALDEVVAAVEANNTDENIRRHDEAVSRYKQKRADLVLLLRDDIERTRRFKFRQKRLFLRDFRSSK